MIVTQKTSNSKIDKLPVINLANNREAWEAFLYNKPIPYTVAYPAVFYYTKRDKYVISFPAFKESYPEVVKGKDNAITEASDILKDGVQDLLNDTGQLPDNKLVLPTINALDKFGTAFKYNRSKSFIKLIKTQVLFP